jgi:hypothetical protein
LRRWHSLMGGEGWRALKGSRQRPPGAWRLGVTRCAYAQAQTMAIWNIWEDPNVIIASDNPP